MGENKVSTKRRVTFQLTLDEDKASEDLDYELKFQRLEEDLNIPEVDLLESPSYTYFFQGEEELRSFSSNRYCCAWDNNYCWSCWNWMKMQCTCGRFCVLLVLVKVLVLGVVVPVQLQEYHGNGNYNEGLDGFPGSEQFGLEPNYGNNNNERLHPDGEHDPPPPDGDMDGIPTDFPSIREVDGLTVERHEDEPETSNPPSPDAAIPSDSETGSTNCPSESHSTSVLQKLESVISAISNIHQTIEKMESLMQGTMVDEQRGKCVSSILQGNQTLSLKHWNQVKKYLSSEERKDSLLAQIVKEAYQGKAENLEKVGGFLERVEACGEKGFPLLLDEMKDFGHVFGGSGIFTIGSKIEKVCGTKGEVWGKLPSSVQSVLGGTFTLQNKFNKGYLYYTKKCVAKHYYHCLDVVTRRVGQDEFASMEVGGDEWRRYHWKVNASDETDSRFYILNDDKYMPYRLQDLTNSPRFKMEEAGSSFDKEMGMFQLILVDEESIQIQIRDTNTFLAGEEFGENSEVLPNSLANGEKDKDKITWIVGKAAGESASNSARGRRGLVFQQDFKEQFKRMVSVQQKV